MEEGVDKFQSCTILSFDAVKKQSSTGLIDSELSLSLWPLKNLTYLVVAKVYFSTCMKLCN